MATQQYNILSCNRRLALEMPPAAGYTFYVHYETPLFCVSPESYRYSIPVGPRVFSPSFVIRWELS
jgi:hypothetical protein